MNLVQTRKEMKKAQTNQERAEILSKYRGTKSRTELIETLISTKRNREVVTNSVYRIEAKNRDEQIKNECLKLNSMSASRISLKRFKKLKRKSFDILSTLDDGYSMGSVKYFYVDGYKIAYEDETSEYARSCKYRAKHGSIVVKMSLNELDKLEYTNGVWQTNHKKPKVLVESGSYSNYNVELVQSV